MKKINITDLEQLVKIYKGILCGITQWMITLTDSIPSEIF